MVVHRRMILQLTSLVDLLFIVMFLQYMELRDTSDRQLRAEAGRLHFAETARLDATQLKDNLQRHAEATEHELQAELSENQALEQKLEELNRQLATTDADRRQEQQKTYRDLQAIAGVVQEMLGVPPDALKSVLSGATEAERVKLRQRMEEMKNEPPGRIVQHLRETAELKKYCEFWEAHIYADNSVGLKISPEPGDANNGADNGRLFVRSADEFANRVVAAAKEHGEPKSLVIVCLTWGNADLATREEVTAGLRAAIIALKPEWGGVKRIELARLGFSEAP